MRSAIQFGSRVIPFTIQYSSRKTLGITVTPDAHVVVHAPEGATLPLIHERLKKKAPWIIRQQSYFLAFEPRIPKRRYVSGETHLYMGRQYLLKVKSAERKVKSNGARDDKGMGEYIKMKGRYLEVYTHDASGARKVVEKWYAGRAKEKFNAIARPLFDGFVSRHKLRPLEYALSIRKMPLRWGSCTPRGKIILNPELIKAPRGCIEYVIIHELCHLVHHDHTAKFFDLQTKEMPTWEKWKERLERLMA